MIRPASTADVPALRELERAAGRGFAELGMDAIADDEPPSAATLERYVHAGRAWVTVDGEDRLLAYLLLDPVDGAAHIEQVSVHPDAARRGLGAALIDRAAAWAADHGCPSLTLMTFRDVPWNRPYYARLGFTTIAPDELTDGLRALADHEARLGIDRWPRVAMRRAVVIPPARSPTRRRPASIDSVTPGPVNVLSCELDMPLDEAGFAHRGTALGDRVGGSRIGAGLYEAFPGAPIWPYHYHWGSEEWLYVLGGEPVLREASGRRALAAGEVVCFPDSHVGAHTLEGPGRFLIFSVYEGRGPWASVYPDSDKVSLSPGRLEVGELRRSLLLPRAAAVDYWHREGSAGERPAAGAIDREPGGAEPLASVNALRLELDLADDPHQGRATALGARLGGADLELTVIELDPGQTQAPYRYEYGREAWALVLDGDLTLRRPDGESTLASGDLACFPEGPAGARRLGNRGATTARALLVSTTGLPANVCEPDTDTWTLHHRGQAPVILRPGAAPVSG